LSTMPKAEVGRKIGAWIMFAKLVLSETCGWMTILIS
jgi:hypothetical protein